MVKQINNMKQKLQIVTAIVAILIGLIACQRSTKASWSELGIVSRP